MGKRVELKTKQTEQSVADFIKGVTDEQKRKDCLKILELMKKYSKEEPKMWGGSMIGFGKLIYKSPNTGREVEWFKIGFSPRKANISLHLISGIQKAGEQLKKLGKYKTGVGCLYINALEDVDVKVLENVIKLSC